MKEKANPGRARTAVIILNWNGQDLLRRFLPSVVAGTDTAVGDVIVADNGSVDGSLKLLADDFDSVQVWPFEKNLGFAAGYNKALQIAAEQGYEYTVLLNSDVAVESGWLVPLVQFMDADQATGAVQPKLLSYKNPGYFEYAGASGGFIDRNGYPFCRGRVFATCEKDTGQYDDITDIFWATGACLMVRTALYNSLGGLDADFFAHMEEIDLCWRIHLAGYDIKVVPQSVVYHLGGGSLPAENPRKTYLNFRNNLLLLHKNLPDGVRGRKLFVRRLLDAIAWARFVLKFDFANANAVLKAHCGFRRMRKAYTRHPDVNLLKTFKQAQRNILADYFLRGKKTF